MDVVNPPAIYCAQPQQDVLLMVSGAAREFPTFLMDARNNGGDWKIESDDGGTADRTILMRAPPSITYHAVSAALASAQARKMNTKVRFDIGRCPVS